MEIFNKDKEKYKAMVMDAYKIRENFLQKRDDFHSFHNNTISSFNYNK